MNKSTRAPWFVGETLNGLPAIIGDGDSVVAYMPNEADGCTYKPYDARLIAAAPMLLKALKQLTELAIGPAGGVTQSDKREAIDMATSAIAAATGEPK